MDGPLLGRDEELGAVLGALSSGRGGVVLVGSGGVGKTRLAEEVLAVAGAEGRVVARIAATRAAADLPLGAFAPLLPELGTEPANLLSWARAQLLERAAGAPLVLFVDDGHTLDPVSAALVASMAVDRSAFVVVTVRRDEPVADAITALWKDGHAERVDLLRLPDDRLAAVAAGWLGGALDPVAAERLCRLSSGNPLALRELLLGARAAGTLVADGTGRWLIEGDVPVTPRLVELVSVRLEALDGPGRRGLELVALGEPVPVDVLCDLCGDEVPARLEELYFVDLRGEEVWLAHPLHGEVLRSELSRIRRRTLLGDLVDAFARGGAAADQLRLAVWSMELGRAVDPDLLEAAARRAWIAVDEEGCASLAGAAHRARPTAESGHLLGRALAALQRHDEAEAVLVEAEGLVGNDRERVLLAMARSENLLRSERSDEARAVVEAALGAVVDPDWRGELAGHGAIQRVLTGDAVAAVAEVEPALAAGAGRPYVQAAIVAGSAWPWMGRPVDAVALAEAAFVVHEELERDDLFQSQPNVHYGSMLSGLCLSGRLAEAWAVGELVRAEASKRGMPGVDAQVSFLLGYVAVLQGRPATAVDQLRRSIAGFRHHGPVHRRRFPLALFVEAATLAGDLDAAALAEEELASIEGSVLRINRSGELASRAWLDVGTGRFEDARAKLDAAADEGLASGYLTGAVAALHRLARCGGAGLAKERAVAAALGVQGPLLTAQLDHVAAIASGRSAALLDVARRFRELGAELYAAEAFTAAAAAHRREGEPRQATAATREAATSRARCEAVATPALAVPGDAVPLSPREREVATLAAQGLSAQAIAERLYLSRRTVENHLQRVYDKLGVRGRAELAEALTGSPG